MKNLVIKLFWIAAIVLNFPTCDSGNSEKDKNNQMATIALLALRSQSSTTTVSTLSPNFNKPEALAVASDGSLYVADTANNQVKKITNETTVTIILDGNNSNGNGSSTLTPQLTSPEGLSVDSSGNLYVGNTDGGNIIRISSSGVATNYAGSFSSNSFADGALLTARFKGPEGLFFNSSSNILYVADADGNLIRSVNVGTSTVSTLAGSTANLSGYIDGSSGTLTNSPKGVVVDSSGNIYFSDNGNNVIRRINSSGVVSTFAGSPAGTSGSTDGTGTAARFNGPYGMTIDSSGNIYVADGNNNTIRRITSAGVVSTIAGIAGTASDIDGSSTIATFNKPRGLALSANQKILYIATTGGGSSSKIRKISF